MRVTHIISNLNFGGAEGQLCTLIEALSGTELKHSVVSMLPQGPLAPRLRDAGAAVIELDGTRSIGSALAVRSVARAIGGTQPDVVQGWMYHGNIAASVASFFLRKSPPMLWGIRQTIDRPSRDRTLTRGVILMGTLFGFRPYRIVYNSEKAALDHERLGYPRAKREVVPNAINTDRFSPRPSARMVWRERLGVPTDAPVIGRFARNVGMKDSTTLFAAFALIREALPGAQLIIAGLGMTEEDADITRLRQHFRLGNSVHVLGLQQEIELLYPALDIFLCSSSDTEGFPNVIAEAMASGVPAVSTDVGAARLIIDDDERVVKTRDANALADAAMKVLRLPAEQRSVLGRRDRDSIVTRFNASAIAARYLQLWERAGNTVRG